MNTSCRNGTLDDARRRGEERTRRQTVVLALEQAMAPLRRAARDLPADRAAALIGPLEREIERQRVNC